MLKLTPCWIDNILLRNKSEMIIKIKCYKQKLYECYASCMRNDVIKKNSVSKADYKLQLIVVSIILNINVCKCIKKKKIKRNINFWWWSQWVHFDRTTIYLCESMQLKKKFLFSKFIHKNEEVIKKVLKKSYHALNVLFTLKIQFPEKKFQSLKTNKKS